MHNHKTSAASAVKSILRGASLVPAALCASATWAADEAPDEVALDEVIVTARFQKESLQETPLAITALTAEALESRALGGVEDVGAYVPNVTMKVGSLSGSASATVFIRGFGQADANFAFDPAVGLYIDDVYYPRVFGNAFDLLDLERVEVLRGPQGTLFGKNTIGGTVRLVSRPPSGSGSGSAEVAVGEMERVNLKASYDAALVPDKLFLRASAGSQKRDGYVDAADYLCVTGGGSDCNRGSQGDENSRAARVAVRWVASDGFEATLIGDYSRLREASQASVLFDTYVIPAGPAGPSLQQRWNSNVAPQFAGTFGAGVQYDDRFLTSDPYTSYVGTIGQTRNDAWGVSATLDWQINDRLSLKSITAYRKFDGDTLNDGDVSPLPITTVQFNEYHDQKSQELRLSGNSFNDHLLWTTGIFLFREYNREVGFARNLEGNWTAIPVLPAPGGVPPAVKTLLPDLNLSQDDNQTSESYAPFLHTNLKLTNQLSLTTGVRYTHEEKTFHIDHLQVEKNLLLLPIQDMEFEYSKTTALGSIQYQWTPAFMTYATYSTGFRAGGVNPRPLSPSSFVTFEPEEADSAEVGIKSEWLDRRVRANLAVFNANYDNIQVAINRTVVINGAPTPQLFTANAAEARSRGAELDMYVRPVPALTFDVALGYTDFEYTSIGTAAFPAASTGLTRDSKRPNTPEWSGSFGTQYTWNVGALGSLSVRGDANFRTETFNDAAGSSALRQGGYTLYNGRIAYETADGGWLVALYGRNLADKYYTVIRFDSSIFGGRLSYVGVPREVGLTVRKMF